MPGFLDGEPARSALAGALERVTALVPYLTASIDPAGPVPVPGPTAPPGPPDPTVPADGVWMSSRALIDDPPWLGRIIRSTGAGIGTDDPVVAASVFVQGYSYRVMTLTIACLTASGVVPDASASRLAVALERNWPSRLSFVEPAVLVMEGTDPSARTTDSDTIGDALRFVVDTAIDAHLRPLVGAVRAGIGVPLGERLLWGNVAASAATAFRTMEGCLGRDVVAVAARFFALAPPLQGLGAFVTIEHGGRRGWFWERTNCCLFDRLPGGIRCADCSRTPVGQRRQAYRESLEPTGA
ncbi:MAG TPA: ferric iron reductase [Acidimicrobiales bacterium]|nr:ferric iron reductase [Acidimicrobiales bacterium]